MHIVYGSNPESSERVSDKYLQINGVGSTLEERRDLVTCFPDGRCDYGLLYIDRGEIEFDLGNGYEWIAEGTFLIFRPGDPHTSRIRKDRDDNHYWVYFSGTAVESILRGLGLFDKKLIRVGKDQKIIDMYEEIIRELLYRSPGFEEAINSKIIGLLTYAARSSGAVNLVPNQNDCIIVGTMWDERISQAMREIQVNNEHFYTVDELAGICHLSKYYFCRIFVKATGLAPHRYLLLMKLDKARSMLSDTDMTVSEIALKLGFSNVTILRRAFRREYGMTPSEFRESSQKSKKSPV